MWTRRPSTGAQNGLHALPITQSKQRLHKQIFEKVPYFLIFWKGGVQLLCSWVQICWNPKVPYFLGVGVGVDLLNLCAVHKCSGQHYMVCTSRASGTLKCTVIGVFSKWSGTFIEFREFRESEELLKLELGSVYKDLLCYLCLCGLVVSSLSLTQEILGSSPTLLIFYFIWFFCHWILWIQWKHLEKTPLAGRANKHRIWYCNCQCTKAAYRIGCV